jgi:oxalate---CoA ligase
VPLDPNLTAVEIEARLKLLDVDAVIVLAGDDSPARDAAERHGIAVIEAAPAAERELGLSLVVPGEGPPAPPNDPEPEAPAFILQTSGTTAEPNLIP